MFAYDPKGHVYMVTDKGFQNVGVSVNEDKHAVTITAGKVVKKVAEVGRVLTVEEVIAKFHVTSGNPLKLIEEEKPESVEVK